MPDISPQVIIRRRAPRGMVSIRGDLADNDLRAAVSAQAGVTLPDVLGASVEGERGLFWMAPDELMLLVPHREALAVEEALQDALGEMHSLVCDVSDARAVFELEGPGLRDVLAKLTPADVSPEGLPAGRLRRTRLAQVPAAIWLCAEDRAEVFCFRSVAGYVQELLDEAARPGAAAQFYAPR